MFELLGASVLLLPVEWLPISPHGFILMFYGLYYGVVSRDLANVCSTYMAVNMGYYKFDGIPSKSIPVNVCSLCDGELMKNVRLDKQQIKEEPIFKLNCGHSFHEVTNRYKHILYI
jgi:RING finger protein 121